MTYATLIFANGAGEAVYGVYRGRLRSIDGMPSLDIHASVQVARAKISTRHRCMETSLRCLARPHETYRAPAFDFGRGKT